MITLLILTACGNENQIIDTNPPSTRVEEAEALVTIPGVDEV